MSARKKCTTCYKVVWFALVLCILINAGGVALLAYSDQRAGMIILSAGVSGAFVFCFGVCMVCVGGCVRPERVLPVSVGR
jgi:hypothetical protein